MKGIVIDRLVPIEGRDLNAMAPRMIVKREGYELMRQTAPRDAVVWLTPGDYKDLLEFFCVLRGKIEITLDTGAQTLGVGDIFYVEGLERDVPMRVLEDAELLYLASQPLFDMLKQYENEMNALLKQIDAKDHITLKHSKNVMRYSVLLLNALRLEGDWADPNFSMDEMVSASLFHDVGKCEIPDDILQKPGRLLREEFEIVKRHVSDSARLLEARFGAAVAKIALQHHERLDGSGYPNRLGGEAICGAARVIAVADSFDAMTQQRPYNLKRDPLDAIGELRTLREKYDARVTRVLARLYEEGALSAVLSGEEG